MRDKLIRSCRSLGLWAWDRAVETMHSAVAASIGTAFLSLVVILLADDPKELFEPDPIKLMSALWLFTFIGALFRDWLPMRPRPIVLNVTVRR